MSQECGCDAIGKNFSEKRVQVTPTSLGEGVTLAPSLNCSCVFERSYRVVVLLTTTHLLF
nr:MAG TPA: hypothetical protein [Caudoviricetes sp.]